MARTSRYRKGKQPLTPVRKLFLNFNITRAQEIRDSGSGGRNVQHGPGLTNINSRITPTSTKRLCVALQNEDPIEDVVIITKLDDVPFCCHENLFEMSRDQLVVAALSLNSKLPAAMQIDVSNHCSDILIRQSIEFIVGLRRTVPPAPKAIKVQSELGTDSEGVGLDVTPPTSPLAARSRRIHQSHIACGRTKLPRLDEESESEDTLKSNRPSKRRKLQICHQRLLSPSDATRISGSIPRARISGKRPLRRETNILSRSYDVNTEFGHLGAAYIKGSGQTVSHQGGISLVESGVPPMTPKNRELGEACDFYHRQPGHSFDDQPLTRLTSDPSEAFGIKQRW